MATTINAANIAVGFDATKLKAGMGMARNEINQLRGVLKDSVSDIDKYNSQLDIVERAYKRGAISADQYRRSVDHLKDKMKEAGAASGMFGKISGFGKAAIGGLAIGSLFAGVSEEMKQIDDTADAAARMGASFNDLMILQRTLQEAGFHGDKTAMAIQKMMVNISKTRAEGGPLVEVFDKMGLSASQLGSMSAVQAFQAIANNFSMVGDDSDQMAAAMEIFGKAGIDIVPALKESVDLIGEMEEHLKNAGKLMTDAEANAIGATNDSLDRLKDYWEGARASLASFVVTAVDAGKSLSDIMPQGEVGRTWGQWFSELTPFGQQMGETVEVFSISPELQKQLDRHDADVKLQEEKKLIEEKARLAEQAALEQAALEEELRQEALAEQEKQWQQVQKQIEAAKLAEDKKKMSGLESERSKLLGSGNQNVSATIAPAIKAGTVEAYKFLNKSNEDKIARQEQIKRLEEINAELKLLNNKNFGIMSRAR
jgi:hypothetical protein